MSAARTFGVRKRIAALVAGRDDVVWASLQRLRVVAFQGRDEAGLADALSGGVGVERLLALRALYDRLEEGLRAVRDAERLVDAVEPRR